MKTEAEMLRHRNFGKKSLNEIKDKLLQLGLSLGIKFESAPKDEKPTLVVGGGGAQAELDNVTEELLIDREFLGHAGGSRLPEISKVRIFAPHGNSVGSKFQLISILDGGVPRTWIGFRHQRRRRKQRRDGAGGRCRRSRLPENSGEVLLGQLCLHQLSPLVH
jgi:hypothetical protein